MIVTHSLHPLSARVSCEAFSFRPWVPFPPHRLCQNSASGPKELLLTEVLLCVGPVLNTYILHHLLSMRAQDVGLIKDESLPKVRAGQWQSKPHKWYYPRVYRCGTGVSEKLQCLAHVPPVSDPEPDMLPCVMWPPMDE